MDIFLSNVKRYNMWYALKWDLVGRSAGLKTGIGGFEPCP
jgi:hypothetical protein